MENIQNQKLQIIAEQILRKMPQGLSKLEQARYIYIQLGQMVSFDEEYWLGNSKTKKRIYTSAQRVKDFKDLSENKIICVSLSKLYNDLLNQIGIKAVQQKEEGELHVSSIIFIGNNAYEVDLQRDLKFIQARRTTMFFGKDIDITGDEPIEDEVLRQIDEKIGYSYEGEKDLKELMDGINRKIDLMPSITEKITCILESIGKYQDILQMGYVEKMNYYDYIIARTLSSKEREKIQKVDMCFKKEKEKYTRCISVANSNGEFTRFIYSEKSGTFLSIEDSNLIELMKKGLKTLRNQKITGLNKRCTKETFAKEEK